MQVKIGDTFAFLTTLVGVNSGDLAGYAPSCQIRGPSGSLMSQVACAWVDASVALELQLLVNDTSDWRPGPAFIDIKFVRASDGFTLSTLTISFIIIRDVTQP